MSDYERGWWAGWRARLAGHVSAHGVYVSGSQGYVAGYLDGLRGVFAARGRMP